MMDPKIISRFRDLQGQYELEVGKRFPSWSTLQKLEADIKDLLLTYPELRDIKKEPKK